MGKEDTSTSKGKDHSRSRSKDKSKSSKGKYTPITTKKFEGLNDTLTTAGVIFDCGTGTKYANDLTKAIEAWFYNEVRIGRCRRDQKHEGEGIYRAK